MLLTITVTCFGCQTPIVDNAIHTDWFVLGTIANRIQAAIVMHRARYAECPYYVSGSEQEPSHDHS